MSELDPYRDPNPFGAIMPPDKEGQSSQNSHSAIMKWVGGLSVLVVVGIPVTFLILLSLGMTGIFD